jgi:hypothetical protein
MAIPPRLNRKLQETLGVEAASDLVGVLESMDASRGGVRELRHEVHEQMTGLRHDMEEQMTGLRHDMQEQMTTLRHDMALGFARIDARFAEMRGELGTGIENVRGDLSSAIEKGLRDQTRFFFLAWAVLLAAFIGLYARN